MDWCPVQEVKRRFGVTAEGVEALVKCGLLISDGETHSPPNLERAVPSAEALHDQVERERRSLGRSPATADNRPVPGGQRGPIERL